MASTSVGLFILLVVLEVASRASGFPTPTPSSGGEWKWGSPVGGTLYISSYQHKYTTARLNVHFLRACECLFETQ